MKAKSKSKKILIVEDDKFISEIYITKLLAMGYQVVHAENGKEALLRINEESPNLILLDILMPEMSGIDVLKKLRADEVHKNIPVIVLTNASEREHATKAMQMGASDYLIKSSFTPDEVVRKIEENMEI